MNHTNEELAAGLQYDSQIEAAETLRRKNVRTAIKASLLVGTALITALWARSNQKTPTVH